MAIPNTLNIGDKTSNEGRYVLFIGNISSLFLFGYCSCLAITIILADFPYTKLVQFMFFWMLVVLTKKKHYLLGTSIVFVFTVLFNLLSVDGKVLLSVFGYPITQGAVQTGVNRGLTLVTLFYMSKSLIDPSLSLRGKIGAFFGKVFLYFDFFTNYMSLIKLKTVWKDLDRLLVASERNLPSVESMKPKATFSLRSVFLYGSVLFGNIILLILNYALFKEGDR